MPQYLWRVRGPQLRSRSIKKSARQKKFTSAKQTEGNKYHHQFSMRGMGLCCKWQLSCTDAITSKPLSQTLFLPGANFGKKSSPWYKITGEKLDEGIEDYYFRVNKAWVEKRMALIFVISPLNSSTRGWAWSHKSWL